MAEEDDDKVEVSADEDTKKPAAGPKPGAPHMVLRVILGLAGLLLIVGFFLPWLKLADEGGTVSGIDLVMANGEVARALVGDGAQRWILLLIPGFGAALSAVGFMGIRYSGQISAGLGVLIVGYGMVTLVIFFFQRTDYGLWLILGGSFIAVTAGAVTFARSRVDAKDAVDSGGGGGGDDGD